MGLASALLLNTRVLADAAILHSASCSATDSLQIVIDGNDYSLVSSAGGAGQMPTATAAS